MFFLIKKQLTAINSIKGAAVLLVLTTALSNILGVIRDHYLAQKIPAEQLDVYYAAFRLPDLIFNLLILGAIASAFIPVFSRVIEDEQGRWRLLNNLLSGATVVLLAAAGVFWLLMPLFIPLLVPNFSAVKQIQTIELSRLFLLSPVFFGLSYIFSGTLNCFRRFFVYSLTPIVYNLAIVSGVLFLTDDFGINGVAWAVISGAFLHLVIQLPVVWHLGWRPRFIFHWADERLRRIIHLMLPRTLSLASNQMMLLVYTTMASAWPGGISYFNLADNIQTMPTVVFGTSLATAIFPHLSVQGAKENFTDFTRWIEKGLRYSLMIFLPASIAIILLRIQIIRLLLGSGHFGWEATVTTANILGLLAISLLASGVIPLLCRGFWALHNTKTPMLIAVLAMAIAIIGGWLLSRTNLGILGLPLGFSLGSIINAGLLCLLLRSHLTGFNKSSMWFLAGRVGLATVVMALTIQAIKWLVGSLVDMSRFWGVASQLIFAAALGLLVYYLVLRLLRVREVSWIKRGA